jgi:hypothetical protein
MVLDLRKAKATHKKLGGHLQNGEVLNVLLDLIQDGAAQPNNIGWSTLKAALGCDDISYKPLTRDTKC